MGRYGEFRYGEQFYGESPDVPISADFQIFDFCYPSDNVLLTLFEYSFITPLRTFGPPNLYFVDNDLRIFSNDSVLNGFRADVSIPLNFTVQFTILPTVLPNDFSDLENSRFFIAGYNAKGKMIGILLSENGGLALSTSNTGPYTVLINSADLFDAGLTYYTFRFIVDAANGKGHIYITPENDVDIIGHQLKYTFSLQNTPIDITTDYLIVEIIGTATDPVDINLDCIKLANKAVIPNKRPVAVPNLYGVVVKGQYAKFDGRSSYDPENQPLSYFWTVTSVPEISTLRITGNALSTSDVTGYTNRIYGDPGSFSEVVEGDYILFKTQDFQYLGSHVMCINSDKSVLYSIDDIFIAGKSIEWFAIKQDRWKDNVESSTLTVVLESLNDPSGLTPNTGDSYRITATALFEWIGYENYIATWTGADWSFSEPEHNDVLFDTSINSCYRYFYQDPPNESFWYKDFVEPNELRHYFNQTLPIASLLPDVVGSYIVTLVVNDGELNSLPVETILNVKRTLSVSGLTPDLNFIWNYLSDFWDLVEDKETITVLWSAFSQLASAELINLWQHSYSKSIKTIQSLFQKQWLSYNFIYEEPNYESLPATIYYENNASGYSDNPGTNEYTYDLNTGDMPSGITSKSVLVLDSIAYVITRYENDTLILSNPIPNPTNKSKNWVIRSSVTSRVSNFSELGINALDSAIFHVVGYNYHETIECYIDGVKENVLVFNDAPLTDYINNSDYTIIFFGVRRRTDISVDNSIIEIPKLQEYINLSISGALAPLEENLHYWVDKIDKSESTSLTQDITLIHFDNIYFEEISRGFDGEYLTTTLFSSTSSDFVTSLGPVGTDISNYVLDTISNKYRLRSVINETTLELYDASLEIGLTNKKWVIRHIVNPPETLWAEITYIDNRKTIENNFGRFIGFTLDDLEARTDNLDYLSAVRGLWYSYWYGPTLSNIRNSAQIILGLPFAVKSGYIVDIRSPFDEGRDRVLLSDDEDPSIVYPYYFPTVVGIAENPDTGSSYIVGDHVDQFNPISKGVEVDDYISDPDWMNPYIGSNDLSEVQKYHYFSVKMTSDIFNLTNLRFMIGFITKTKPTYTYPFFVVLQSYSDEVQITDRTVLGPAIPENGTYPESWESFPIPYGWVDSPIESPRSEEPVFDITKRWPENRFTDVPKKYSDIFGGLHLSDTPGRTPDNWNGSFPEGFNKTHTPTRSDGVLKYDNKNGDGQLIHRYDTSTYAPDYFDTYDGNMESSSEPGDIDSPWIIIGSPTILAKSTSIKRNGLRSLEVSHNLSGVGCYNDFPSTADRGFQIAITGWVYIVEGQAHFRLRDQDGSTYLAETRISEPIEEWRQFVLHAWKLSSDTTPARFEILTGKAGGHFYVDSVEAFLEIVPWDQIGFDRMYGGRTGGYTIPGGSPDEYIQFRLHKYLDTVPPGEYNLTYDTGVFTFDMSEKEGDVLILSGPNTQSPSSTPPVSWPNPGPNDIWDGPYGPEVVDWTNVTHPGADLTQGGWSPPNKTLLYDTNLPEGWYTRITTSRKHRARKIIPNMSDV